MLDHGAGEDRLKDLRDGPLICKSTEEISNAREQLAADPSSVLNLRPMPGIVLRINEACQNQQTNINEIIELIECEPTIVAKILSVVNSSIYGHSREITSINQAIVVLGFKNLSKLATSVASKEVFEKGDAGKQERMFVYEHCLAVAATSRVLSKQTYPDVDDGTAFLAGLLHDIGKLFFIDLAPQAYSLIPSTETAGSLLEWEQDSFGLNHAMLGKQFAAMNGLPNTIVESIADHHADEKDIAPTSKVIQIANGLARFWGMGSDPSEADEFVNQWMQNTSEELVEGVRENTDEQFQVLKAMFLD